MSWAERFDLWGRGARAPLLAAFIALVAGLPGVLAVPPIDRDESRFAEASAQMLESGDFVSIHFQDQPRFKKPVGIYWLQALAVGAVSHVEDRAIWAYRLPSLAGAMLAAAACAWGAAAFLGPGLALLAGALLGSSFMVSTEAGIAATDGALCGAVTLAMAALGRLYLAARGGPPAGRLTKVLLWTGVSLSVLLKGPIGPMVMGLTLLALAIWERRLRWMATLGWGWGLIGLAAVTLPWAMAITVVSDGAFWGAAVGGDLAPKLMGDQESHGAPFGFHLALSPLLLFPATLLLPAGALAAWRGRATPAVRFALCWLIPAWLVFEITPTKLIHYTLPLYGALAWLMASALAQPPMIAPLGPRVRALGVGLLVAAGAVFALAGPLAIARLHVPLAERWGLLAALLFLTASGGAAWLYWRREAVAATAFASAVALVAHAVLIGGLVPALRPLWLSTEVVRALEAIGANPREGVAQGPVTVAGYAEPSLVFLLGADTELGGAKDAADAIGDGRPAIVEGRADDAFKAALRADGAGARLGAQVQGLDYSKGRADTLRIYLPKSPDKTP